MKKIIFILLLCVPFMSHANTYMQIKLQGHTMRVVEYPIGNDDYEIQVVKVEKETPLGEVLFENNAITGVNGVFFCPIDYDWCKTDTGYSDSERYLEGHKYASYTTTDMRAVFGWTKDEIPFIYQSGLINPEDEEEIYYGLGNLPLLLYDGENMLQRYHEDDILPPHMYIKGTRNFVCSNQDKTSIYFGLVYDATIDELATTLLEFGCYDALNLDAGLTTSFVYNGSYLVGPQKRGVLDGIAIVNHQIDRKKIHKEAVELSNYIIKNYIKKSRNPNTQKKYQTLFLEAFKKARSKIYDQNATDVYWKNFVGEIDKIGYKIDISEVETLKKVLLINEIYDIIKNTHL